MKKLATCILLFAVISVLSAETIPHVTGIIAKDCKGNTYDIDAILNSGRHIWVHQAFSG